MVIAGLKRLGILIAVVVVLAVVAGALGAVVLHVPVRRGVSVACYGLGAMLLVSGFFHGVRPPVRIEEEAGIFSMFGVLLTRGRIRTASLDERHDSISSSALFVGLALALIFVGALVDPVHRLL
jgi:hypothetical protein